MAEKNTPRLLILKVYYAVVAWSSGMRPHYLICAGGSWGAGWRGNLHFFFVFSSFHRIFTLWLASVYSHC